MLVEGCTSPLLLRHAFLYLVQILRRHREALYWLDFKFAVLNTPVRIRDMGMIFMSRRANGKWDGSPMFIE